MTTLVLVRHGMTDDVGKRLVGWMAGRPLNGLEIAGVVAPCGVGAEIGEAEPTEAPPVIQPTPAPTIKPAPAKPQPRTPARRAPWTR